MTPVPSGRPGLTALTAALLTALLFVPALGARETVPTAQAQDQAAPGVPPSAKMSREVFEAMKSEPLLAATMIFENAARQFNLRVDREYAHQPADLRPYLTPRAFAHLSEELLKLYREGDPRGITEFAEILDVDAPLAEKIAFIETMTQAYLEAEALRKNEAAPGDSGDPADEPSGKTETPPASPL